MAKGWSILAGEFSVFRDGNYKFYFTNSYSTYYLCPNQKMLYHLLFSLMFVAYFVLLIVPDFINSLFKRKSI